MCGIIGFVGDKKASPTVLKGLKRLEYRGYDSTGMATTADGRIWLKKDIGTPSEIEERQHLNRLPGKTGIGHVRWATHGEVTPANAHPHFDCHQQIAVVHNGIIENYQELRHHYQGGEPSPWSG